MLQTQKPQKEANLIRDVGADVVVLVMVVLDMAMVPLVGTVGMVVMDSAVPSSPPLSTLAMAIHTSLLKCKYVNISLLCLRS